MYPLWITSTIPRSLVPTFVLTTLPIYVAIFDIFSEFQSCFSSCMLNLSTWLFYKTVKFNIPQNHFIASVSLFFTISPESSEMLLFATITKTPTQLFKQ